MMPGMGVEAWAWSREEARIRYPDDLVLETDEELTRGGVAWTSRTVGGNEGGHLVMYPVETEAIFVKDFFRQLNLLTAGGNGWWGVVLTMFGKTDDGVEENLLMRMRRDLSVWYRSHIYLLVCQEGAGLGQILDVCANIFAVEENNFTPLELLIEMGRCLGPRLRMVGHEEVGTLWGGIPDERGRLKLPGGGLKSIGHMDKELLEKLYAVGWPVGAFVRLAREFPYVTNRFKCFGDLVGFWDTFNVGGAQFGDYLRGRQKYFWDEEISQTSGPRGE
jgi:hypothetical protein